MTKSLRLPQADSDGALYQHVGRYAGQMVLTAFDMIGGVDRFAAWAEKNPTDFYTKVFPKVIAKPVEHGVTKDVEALLERLDAVDASDRAMVIEGESRVVERD